MITDRGPELAHGRIVIATKWRAGGQAAAPAGRNLALPCENRRFLPRYVFDGDELRFRGVVALSARSHDPKSLSPSSH